MGSSNMSASFWCCVMPLFFCFASFVGIFVLVRRVKQNGAQDAYSIMNRLMLPNPQSLHRRVEQARLSAPNATTPQLAEKMIERAAFNAGFVGFVTGLPGLTAMPMTLPIDFVSTGRIQAAMIQTIAFAFDRVDGPDDEDISAKKTYMLMMGSINALPGANSLVVQLIARCGAKWIFEAVPLLGGIVGFGVNYYVTKTIGNLAVKHFTGELNKDYINDKVKGVLQQVRVPQVLVASAPPALLASAVAAAPVVSYEPMPPQRRYSPTATIAFEDEMPVLHERRCPNGHLNPLMNRFCNHCGASFDPAAA